MSAPTVTGVTAGMLTVIDNYRLGVTPTSDGTVTVSVAANMVQDSAGNGNASATAEVTSDRTSPDFTSSTGPSAVENSTIVLTVTATDAHGPATFTITGGVDAAKFNITPAGVLTFATAPDFEIPTDSGSNNVYDLIVTANDSLGNSKTQGIAVTDRKSTRLNSSHGGISRMPSSA